MSYFVQYLRNIEPCGIVSGFISLCHIIHNLQASCFYVRGLITTLDQFWSNLPDGLLLTSVCPLRQFMLDSCGELMTLLWQAHSDTENQLNPWYFIQTVMTGQWSSVFIWCTGTCRIGLASHGNIYPPWLFIHCVGQKLFYFGLSHGGYLDLT